MDTTCPRCNEGSVAAYAYGEAREAVRVCDECEALWLGHEGDLTGTGFEDYTVFAQERGGRGLWHELRPPATPEHPMLPFLVDLELAYDPKAHRDYEPVELVRYALTTTDYWAELAVSWLEQGVPTHGTTAELEHVASQALWPQPLRHRARRLLTAAGQAP